MKRVLEVIYLERDDRYIYIKRDPNNMEIVELNYWHGIDAMDMAMHPDKGLLKFYKICMEAEAFNKQAMTEFDIINKIIWLHFDVKNSLLE